jgi:hypothetical protein
MSAAAAATPDIAGNLETGTAGGSLLGGGGTSDLLGGLTGGGLGGGGLDFSPDMSGGLSGGFLGGGDLSNLAMDPMSQGFFGGGTDTSGAAGGGTSPAGNLAGQLPTNQFQPQAGNIGNYNAGGAASAGGGGQGGGLSGLFNYAGGPTASVNQSNNPFSEFNQAVPVNNQGAFSTVPSDVSAYNPQPDVQTLTAPSQYPLSAQAEAADQYSQGGPGGTTAPTTASNANDLTSQLFTGENYLPPNAANATGNIPFATDVTPPGNPAMGGDFLSPTPMGSGNVPVTNQAQANTPIGAGSGYNYETAFDPSSGQLAGTMPQPGAAAGSGGPPGSTGGGNNGSGQAFTPGQWYRDPQGQMAQYHADGTWTDQNGNPVKPTDYGNPNQQAGGGQGQGGGRAGIGGIGGMLGNLMRMMPPQVQQALQQFMQNPAVQQFLNQLQQTNPQLAQAISSLLGGQPGQPGVPGAGTMPPGVGTPGGTLPSVSNANPPGPLSIGPGGQFIDGNGNPVTPRVNPGDVDRGPNAYRSPIPEADANRMRAQRQQALARQAGPPPGTTPAGQTSDGRPAFRAADGSLVGVDGQPLDGQTRTTRSNAGNAVSGPRQANRAAVERGLQAEGFSQNAIRGIEMNIDDENGSWNPANTSGDSGNAIGLFQFNRHGSQPAFRRWVGNRNWKDPELQAQFVGQYMKSMYPAEFAAMNRARSPGQAAVIFLRTFERPSPGNMARRTREYESAERPLGIS